MTKAKAPTSTATMPTVPSTGEELAEVMADPKALEALLGGDADDRAEWFIAYNKLVNKGETISKEISEQVSTVMMEWLKDEGAVDRPDMGELADEIAARFTPHAPAQDTTIYNPKALGASIDDMFDNSIGFFQTIWHNAQQTPANSERLGRLRNAFSESVPSEGGFLVPERLRSELLRVSLETAVVRPRARVIPMDSLRVPFPAIDSTSNVSSVFGGIIGYWTEEGATLTGSQPTFRRLVLDAKKLTVYTDIPNELIADSAISFMAFIDQIFPEALSFYEDIAFFTGNGTGEPLGFLNADAAIEITKETGQAANTIVWENILKMYARMLPSSLNRAVWIASPDTFPELATMAVNVGTGGSAVWITNGVGSAPLTILGRPLIFSEKCKTLGTSGDLNFCDLGFYLVGDRQVMSARSSEHFKFQSDQTSFRIIERLDGRPWLNSAITPQNNSATMSPFVKIATRA